MLESHNEQLEFNPLQEVEYFLTKMKYQLKEAGLNAARFTLLRGYSAAETASYIAINTLINDIQKDSINPRNSIGFAQHAKILLEQFHNHQENGLLSPALANNRSQAVIELISAYQPAELSIDNTQKNRLIEKECLAISRINYNRQSQ